MQRQSLLRLAVLATLVVLAWWWLRRRQLTTAAAADVTFFYLPGCGWCDKFKPEWARFVELAKQRSITTREVNAGDDQRRESERLGITSFPTVLIRGMQYDGERTAEALLDAAIAAVT